MKSSKVLQVDSFKVSVTTYHCEWTDYMVNVCVHGWKWWGDSWIASYVAINPLWTNRKFTDRQTGIKKISYNKSLVTTSIKG